MLRYGIPEYRLPNDILDKEIKEIIDMGVDVKHKTLGKDFTVGGLFKGGFKAIFLAIGAYDTRSMRIEGEESKTVIQGIQSTAWAAQLVPAERRSLLSASGVKRFSTKAVKISAVKIA